MEAGEHDRLMAFLSHLPQLTASVLMEIVGSAVQAGGLKLAGRGLADTTRLASSSPDIWRGVCASNADVIGVALDALIDRLTQLRGGLQQGGVVDALFAEAAKWRAELMKGDG
jgi:prephenate dehydrogenase